MLSNFEIKKGEVKILTCDKMFIKAFQTANAFIGLFLQNDNSNRQSYHAVETL